MARKALTTENLKERMGDALLDLLRSKPYSEISVSEITDTADVGRATYYRHFSSKEEVLFFKLDSVFKSHTLAEGHAPNPHSKGAMETYFREYFQNLTANKEILERIYDAGLDYLFFIYMYRNVVVGVADQDLIDRYRVALHAASTFAIVDQWISSGFEQDTEDLIYMLRHQLHPRKQSPADNEA